MKTRTLLPTTHTKTTTPEVDQQCRQVCKAVAEVWGVPEELLKGKTRKQPIAFARQVTFTLLTQLKKVDAEDVAQFFGCTVGNISAGVRRVQYLCDTDKDISDAISTVIKRLG